MRVEANIFLGFEFKSLGTFLKINFIGDKRPAFGLDLPIKNLPLKRPKALPGETHPTTVRFLPLGCFDVGILTLLF